MTDTENFERLFIKRGLREIFPEYLIITDEFWESNYMEIFKRIRKIKWDYFHRFKREIIYDDHSLEALCEIGMFYFTFFKFHQI